MRRIIFFGLLFLGLFPLQAHAEEEPDILVGLTESATIVKVGSPGDHLFFDLATGDTIITARGGEYRQLGATPEGILVSDYRSFPGSIGIRAVKPGGRIYLNGSAYRGQLIISRNGSGGLSVVNRLPLEQYLYGVIPKEMSPSWPEQALMAQAVAARTYALHVMASGKYAGKGYDVLASVDSQVYGGAGVEDPRSTRAVDATRGQVLTYGGALARTLFHSSSGGHTENSENVFSGFYPYLRGVPDFDQDSPRYSWERTFTIEEIAQAVKAAGHELGRLFRVWVSGERGVSGRATTVILEGSLGKAEMRANDFRMAVGLWSTLFTIHEQPGGYRYGTKKHPPDQPVTVVGKKRTRAIPLSSAAVLGRAGVVSRAGSYNVLSRQQVPDALTFEGRGWGHGVGLSQWGARALALRGYNYQQILEYYYQGTSLETRY